MRGGPLSAAECKRIEADFVEKYERTYGKDSAYTAAGIEYVTLRVIATMEMARPALDRAAAPAAGSTSIVARRMAFFQPGGFIETDIHDGGAVRPGQAIAGPAIVRRAADTVVLPPGVRADVDAFGGMVLTRPKEARS